MFLEAKFFSIYSQFKEIRV